mgnify:CR=1 FL=1|tara:strand:- start:50 stop:580 length:531 start_codon:yes stop_codon:yes gene_type:complete
MINKVADRIATSVIELSGVNIYENTRKRKYVELRALVCFILRNKLNVRWTEISRFFESKGKNMDHATAIHLTKQYPIYKKFNPMLEDYELCFAFESEDILKELEDDDFIQDKYEANKLNYIQNKYLILDAKYQKLYNESNANPLIKLINRIPESQYNEMYERMDMLIKSWQWKNVN